MTTLEERHRHVRRRVWKIHGVSLVALLAILAWYGFRLFFCWGSNIGLLRVNQDFGTQSSGQTPRGPGRERQRAVWGALGMGTSGDKSKGV